jgi:hypothetical protein
MTLYDTLKKAYNFSRKRVINMGGKLLWTGLTFILALVPFLKALGLNVSDVFVLVGAVLMVIGCVLMWLGK